MVPTTDFPALDEKFLDAVVAIARQAGTIIMSHYHAGTPIHAKDDGSPVTIADQAAEDAIIAGLQQLTPDMPIVAEEIMASGAPTILNGTSFWLVDPLDGTKEFIRRNGEFTVNIALVQHNMPVMGVITAPALREEYTGIIGRSARKNIHDHGWQTMMCQSPHPDAGWRITSSRSHADKDDATMLVDTIRITSRSTRGSSLKFCDVAAGRADIYPRSGPTCEWDTAAGHAILLAAGGFMTRPDGSAFNYGKSDQQFLNSGFIASALPQAQHQTLLKKQA